MHGTFIAKTKESRVMETRKFSSTCGAIGLCVGLVGLLALTGCHKDRSTRYGIAEEAQPASAIAVDTDGDGIPDVQDNCPMARHVASGGRGLCFHDLVLRHCAHL